MFQKSGFDFYKTTALYFGQTLLELLAVSDVVLRLPFGLCDPYSPKVSLQLQLILPSANLFVLGGSGYGMDPLGADEIKTS